MLPTFLSLILGTFLFPVLSLTALLGVVGYFISWLKNNGKL